MLYPWNTLPPTMMYCHSDHQTMRDYLIPNILAFRANCDTDVKDSLMELRLVRDKVSNSYINGKHLTAYIRLETDGAELSAKVKTGFMAAMTKLGLTANVVVYDGAWLNMPTNEGFAEQLKNDSLLVYKKSEPDCYISAKCCIDSYYENSAEYDGKPHGFYDFEMLFEFITYFPLLSWSDMNASIAEAPINYGSVEDYPYKTVVKHINIWCSEYYLHEPKWLRNTQYYDPFKPLPYQDEFDRDSL